MDESAQYVQDCFKLLMELGIIDSQFQFSEQFLNACKNYYSVMRAEHRRAPNDMLHHLNGKMEQLSECFDDKRLSELANHGRTILNARFERFMTKCLV